MVEALGAAGAGDVADSELGGPRPGAHVVDYLLHGLVPVAAPLVAGVDHQPPEVVGGPVRLVIEHDKAHWRIGGVDGPVPGVGFKMGLGQGDGVAGHEVLLRCGDV